MSIDSKTIFLVDDDITNLANGYDTLSPLYKIFTMNSGALLVKMLESNTPDLILLDVEMPDMNGCETIEILKSKEETKNLILQPAQLYDADKIGIRDDVLQKKGKFTNKEFNEIKLHDSLNAFKDIEILEDV